MMKRRSRAAKVCAKCPLFVTQHAEMNNNGQILKKECSFGQARVSKIGIELDLDPTHNGRNQDGTALAVSFSVNCPPASARSLARSHVSVAALSLSLSGCGCVPVLSHLRHTRSILFAMQILPKHLSESTSISTWTVPPSVPRMHVCPTEW